MSSAREHGSVTLLRDRHVGRYRNADIWAKSELSRTDAGRLLRLDPNAEFAPRRDCLYSTACILQLPFVARDSQLPTIAAFTGWTGWTRKRVLIAC